jgi:chemotaxis response regulator CheB
MPSPERVKLLALALSLFLLLCEALMTKGRGRQSQFFKRIARKKREHALLSCNGLELHSLVCVDSSTGGAALVEVLLDMMPAETAYLKYTVQRMGSAMKRQNLPGNHKYKA